MTNRRTARTDAGLTVVELSVTVLLMSVVSLIVLNFFDQTLKVTNRADAQVRTEQDAQLALRTIGQDLRAANPIISIPTTCSTMATCVRFEVQRPTNDRPLCKSTITYRVASGSLVQDRIDTNCATARNYSARRIIGITNTSSQPVFQYFDRSGAAISPTQTCTNTQIPPCPVNARSVKVNLVAVYGSAPPSSLELTTTAALRNNR